MWKKIVIPNFMSTVLFHVVQGMKGSVSQVQPKNQTVNQNNPKLRWIASIGWKQTQDKYFRNKISFERSKGQFDDCSP